MFIGSTDISKTNKTYHINAFYDKRKFFKKRSETKVLRKVHIKINVTQNNLTVMKNRHLTE